jgi:hypothetical protein
VLANGPNNLLAQTTVLVESKPERAGDLLSRTLAGTGRKLSWLLLYDLGMRQYALNIVFVK